MSFIKKMISSSFVRRFTGDVFLNTIGFAVYIIIQQIILLPIVARYTNDNTFSAVVVFISVYSIICNTIGNEIGITRQVRFEEDIHNNINYTYYNSIIILLSPVMMGVAIFIFLFFDFSIDELVVFSLIIVLGSFRLYSASYFRLKKNFKRIVFQNLIYSLGAIIGLAIFMHVEKSYLPFLFAELCSVFYGYVKSDFSFQTVFLKNGSDKYRKIGSTFSDLGMMSLLANLMVYFDKLVMYPLLGPSAVAVYFAANSMSKAINLIVNPLYSVVLSWLLTSRNSDKEVIIDATKKLNIIVVLAATVISWPISYVALKLLYPQYFLAALPMLWPICASVGFGVSNSFLKGVLLKYYESRKLLISNISFFVVFILLAIPLSKWIGIIGFVYANLLARFEQWAVFVWFLKKC